MFVQDEHRKVSADHMRHCSLNPCNNNLINNIPDEAADDNILKLITKTICPEKNRDHGMTFKATVPVHRFRIDTLGLQMPEMPESLLQ